MEEESDDNTMAATTRPGVLKSEAVSKGYNFASTWEQVHSLFSTLFRFSPDLLDLFERITKIM